MKITVVQMIGVALGVLGMWAIPVWAYEESQVKQGGNDSWAGDFSWRDA